MRTGNRRRVAALGLGLAAALTTTGCLQSPVGGQGEGAGLSGFVDNAQADGDGKVVVLGAFGGVEQESFEASIAAFEEESGIDVEYTADQDFTTTIKTRVGSGDSPDIGIFPQPGGLAEFVDEGAVQPIDTFLDYDALDRTLVPGFLDFARFEGRVYGAPMRMAVKSVVYYPKKAWEQAGHPTEFETYQDLMKFSQDLVDQGETPWCMGWESAQATGWVGTDGLEQMVLVTAGPDVYDQWVDHQIPFSDPVIATALDAYGEIAKGEGMVLGGKRAILNTPFAEAGLPMFDQAGPKCWMERQGNFAIGFYPAEIQDVLDEELGVFKFPRFEGGYDGDPTLVGGDYAAVFNGNDEDVQEFMQFLSSDQFGAEWAQAGGWLSPHATFDGSHYPDDVTRAIADMAYQASATSYDASDLMPKSVGSGTFWTEMVKWIDGASTQETLDALEESWPAEGEEQ
ncbi:carbohydrate ABC transporter substrate-binding protein [Nocardioides gansuensis]|uniref:Carbohydrate ABC transporter substrate-binding protein n=1 Tax=Nocardioides gansuensis TaxID=2138300 RepID=A0A2T8F7E5_9ACTN|nr:extracellular solute-binding protein [Nocardioides gansuensis]PVG81633.1 carbohydrate ABC transporter substrate-binding protein [Nocardioides gansuensis]